MSIEHQPHILRKHLEEWCGGTEPPTIVTVNRDDHELYVDIYPSGSNLHDGEILERDTREQFLISESQRIGHDEVAAYACRAIDSAARHSAAAAFRPYIRG